MRVQIGIRNKSAPTPKGRPLHRYSSPIYDFRAEPSMPRLTPVHWKILECIFQKDGFVFKRQDGSHRAYEKPNVIRPVIIPTYREIDVEIIRSNMRTAGMSRKRYFQLLKECKKTI